jgi:hypothetical protein
MKKIWLLCLCLASLGLVWCFHVPDEDWLPSKNKVDSEKVKNNIEVEQAIDSFMDWINSISSELDEMKNEEITTEEWENVEVEDEIIDSEVTDEEVDNEVIEENTVSEE